MEKRNPNLPKSFHSEVNNALMRIAKDYGIQIQYNIAQSATNGQQVTIPMIVDCSASNNAKYAQQQWENCFAWPPLQKSDFGKELQFPDDPEIYRIVGGEQRPYSSSKVVLLRLSDNQEFVASIDEIAPVLCKDGRPKHPWDDPDQRDFRRNLWNEECRVVGMLPEDFGKEIFLQGVPVRIVGVRSAFRDRNGTLRHRSQFKKAILVWSVQDYDIVAFGATIDEVRAALAVSQKEEA